MKSFKNKRILVTGACGTIGSELVRTLIQSDQYLPAEVIGIDNNESELFFRNNGFIEMIVFVSF